MLTQFFPFLKIKVPWSYALDRSTEHKKSYPITYRSCNRLLTNNFPSVALSLPQVGANGDPGNLNCTDPYFDSVTTSWSLLSSLKKSDLDIICDTYLIIHEKMRVSSIKVYILIMKLIIYYNFFTVFFFHNFYNYYDLVCFSHCENCSLF